MKRIVIIGGSGSGKSTLSTILGDKYSIPVLHFDRIFYTENWGQPRNDEFLNTLEQTINLDEWVIDGNFAMFLFKKRLERADTIIFLDYSRFWNLFSIVKRYLKYKGKIRADLAEGCYEGIDMPYIMDVLINFPKNDRPKLYNYINDYSEKVIIFKNRKSLNKWLNEL